MEPGLGCTKCFCNGWFLYGFRQLRKSIIDLYGNDSTEQQTMQ